MTWEEFIALPLDKRGAAFQQLNPYENAPVFEGVRLAFLDAHPECGPPHEVGVGEVGMLGPLNGVAVKVAPGVKLRVPMWFMGMPVVKLVQAKTGGWKRAR